jgi:GDSL-like Lipase/Acylhydrolase family
MRRLLPTRFPGVCFEVVNLALGGYDSYQDYERMRVDGTPLAPDLVVINSGINDVRNALYARLTDPPDPRTLMWEPVMRTMREEAQRGPRLSTVLQHYSYLARIPGYALEVWGQRQGLKVIRVTEPDDSAIGYFETNVVRTTELAYGVGAEVILSVPPSALSMRNKPSDPVEKSYWVRDAGTTEAYRRRLAARMREIAERQRAAGRRVAYVTHDVPLEQFLDDAHLTGAGNQTVAYGLLEAAGPIIQAGLPDRRARCE